MSDLGSTLADGVVTSVLLLMALVLSPFAQHVFPKVFGINKASSTGDDLVDPIKAAPGFVVPCQIHHARMAPRQSRHSFRYPSLYFALNLQEMEAGLLDSNFGFAWQGQKAQNAKRARWSLTKIAPENFGRKTFPGSSKRVGQWIEQSILRKLLFELRFRGYLKTGPQDLSVDVDVKDAVTTWSEEVGQVWAVAMPTLIGLAGFNPLTVYYVYRPAMTADEARGPLWLAVLEVHNTFNERHIYVCEVGKDEDQIKRKGYDYAWTFARDFHVSPFNDRLGYYQLFLRNMWSTNETLPTIDVRLLLLSEEVVEGGYIKEKRVLQKKLLATLSSSQAASATSKATTPALPLTRFNIAKALSRQPFDLFLPVSRIMWEAAKLHWKRKLPVYIRPEPRGEAMDESLASRHSSDFDGTGWPIAHNPAQGAEGRKTGDIYWNDESGVENRCRQAVLSWLKWRTKESDETSVVIQSLNPESDDVIIDGGDLSHYRYSKSREHTLTLYLLSSAIFVDLCLYQPSHAFLFGSKMERMWGVNDTQAFEKIFNGQPVTPSQNRRSISVRLARMLRVKYMRWATSTAIYERRADDGTDKAALTEIALQLVTDAGATHPLDQDGYTLSLLIAIAAQILIIMATASISNLLRVKYVRPPWAQVGEGMQHLHEARKTR